MNFIEFKHLMYTLNHIECIDRHQLDDLISNIEYSMMSRSAWPSRFDIYDDIDWSTIYDI